MGLEGLEMMETILVVDDEESTVDVLIYVLEEAGYKVLSAYDGKEAFEIYCQHQHSIDLVVTDNIMPNDGYTLLENIRRIDPYIKYIIICSWTCEAERGCEQKGQLWKPILRRPFKPKHILGLVRDVLDGKVECGFPKDCIEAELAQKKKESTPVPPFILPLRNPKTGEIEQYQHITDTIDIDEGIPTFTHTKAGLSVSESEAKIRRVDNEGEELFSKNNLVAFESATKEQDAARKDIDNLLEALLKEEKKKESTLIETISLSRATNQSPQLESSFSGYQDIGLHPRNDAPPEQPREQEERLELPKTEDWYFDKQWLTATQDNHFEELQEYLRTNPNATHLVKTQFVNGITESRVIACHNHLVDLIGLEPDKILNGTIWTVIFGAINNLIDDREIRDLFVQSQQERQNQLDTTPNEDLPNIFLPIDTSTAKAKYPLQKAKYIVTISQKVLPFDNSIRTVSLSGLDLPVSDSEFEKNKEQLRRYLRQNVINLATKRENKVLTRKKGRGKLVNQNSKDLEDTCKPRNDDPTEAQYLFWIVQAGWHYDKKLLIEMGKQNPYILENIQTYIKNHSNAAYILYETTINFDGGKRGIKPTIALVNQRILDLFDISADILGKTIWELENFGARFTPKQSWEWVIQQQATTANNQTNPEEAYAVFDTRIKPEKKSFRGYYFIKNHSEPLFSNDLCFIRAINYEINSWPCLPTSSFLIQDLLFVLDEYKSKVHWKSLDVSKYHKAQLSLDLYLGLFEFDGKVETLRKELYQKCFNMLAFHTLPALAKSSSPTRYVPLSELKTTISLGNFISCNFFVKEKTIYGNCHIESFINLTSNKAINAVMGFYDARLDIAASLSQAVIDKFDQWYSSKFSFPSTSNILDGTQADTSIFAFLLRELDLEQDVKLLQSQRTHIQAITNLLTDIYQCHKTIESAIYFTFFSFDPDLFTPDTLSFGNDLDHIFQVAYSTALAAKPKIREIEKYQSKKGIKSSSQIKGEVYNLAYALAEIHLTFCYYLYELYIKLTNLGFIDKVKTLFDYDLLMEKPVSFDVAPIVPTDSETKSIAAQKIILRAKRAISHILPEFFDLPESEAQAVVLQIQQLMMQRYTEEQQLRAKRQELENVQTINDDPNIDDPIGSIRGIYFDDQAREKAVSLLKEKGFDDKETIEKIRNGKFSVKTYFTRCTRNSCNNCKIKPSHKKKEIVFSYINGRKSVFIPQELRTWFKKSLNEHLNFNKAFIKKQLAV